MRLLHLHSGNIYGGIETMLVTIARERERAGGAEVEFALCFPGRLHDELSAAGFAPEQLGEVRLRQPNSLRRVRQRLRTLLKDRRPDAVVVHGPWAQAVFGAEVRRAGVPLVLWLHGRSHGIIHRLAVQTPPDAIICNSAATAGTLAPAYDHLPRVVVHCPVSRPPAPDAALRADVRASLDTAADAVVVVQAGRLEAWKGHEVHLRALGRLSDVPSWALWIAGGAGSPAEAAYVRRLQALASDAGIGDRVRFLGERRDVARLLAAADIFCQPNTEPEPFGLVYIEALYAGLPVVASDEGGPREIVTAACGALVRPGDEAELAAVLHRLMASADRRRELAAGAAGRAAALCDPRRQIRLADQFIAGVAGRRGAA